MADTSGPERQQPRSAWMFEDHYEGTLYRAGQVLHTSVARLYAAMGRTRFRRATLRLLDRLGPGPVSEFDASSIEPGTIVRRRVIASAWEECAAEGRVAS